MKETTRTITRTEYLAALGLFMLAGRRTDDAEKALAECAEVLGTGQDYLSDAIWGDSARSEEGFDNVLAQEGISVEVKP